MFLAYGYGLNKSHDEQMTFSKPFSLRIPVGTRFPFPDRSLARDAATVWILIGTVQFVGKLVSHFVIDEVLNSRCRFVQVVCFQIEVLRHVAFPQAV